MRKNLVAIALFVFVTTGACIQTGNHENIGDKISEAMSSDGQYIVLETKTFSETAVSEIKADLVSADIQVIGDANGATTVKVKTKGRDVESLSQDELRSRVDKNYKIEVVQRGSVVNILVHFKRKNIPQRERLSFKFEVHTGSSANAAIHTVSGDIKLNQLASAQAGSTSGDIDIAGMQKDAKLSSVSGDIMMANIDGTVQASSTSGDIKGTHLGEIKLAESTSGDVELDAGGLAGDVTLKTVSGDISLRLPSETSASIDLGTVSGDLSVMGFSNTTYEKQSRRSLKARINGGGNKIEGHTVSGDIAIKQ